MPHLIAIQGPLGAGKTSVMSFLATYWKSQVRALGGDINLFSNYELKDSQMMTHYEHWYDVAESQGSICCWDEAHMAFDSRQWARSGNIYATQTLFYARKVKAIQVFATPSIDNIDSRIRGIVEVLISVQNNGKKGIALHFYDYQSRHLGQFGKYLRTAYIPRWKVNKLYELELFDTDNMVAGFPLPDTDAKAKKFFEKFQEIHDKHRGKKRGIA